MADVNVEISNENISRTKHFRWFNEILSSVLEDLEEFPYAMIKGPVLAIQAYGNAEARDYHDIDFLIPKNKREDFISILIKNGFLANIRNSDGSFRELTRNERIILANSHQDIDYIKIQGDIHVDVDINYDVFWGEYRGPRIDINNDFLNDLKTMDIFGKKVKVLSKAKSFIQLCLHHYREMNAIYFYKLKNPFRKSNFKDIFFLAKKMSMDDKTEFIELVRKYKIEKYVYYVIYHANYFFEEEWLTDLVKCFGSEEGYILINQYGLREEEKKEWPFSLEVRSEIKDLYEELKRFLSDDDIKKAEEVVGFISIMN